MATIHKRKTGSGEVVWELTHGTGADRVRFVAGRTKEEAQVVLDRFSRQLALHGEAPKDLQVGNAIAEYDEHLRHNRRKSTARRYSRVLRTFSQCFLGVFHPDLRRLRDVKPTHVEEYKRRRSDGQITEAPSEEELKREAGIRQELTETKKHDGRKQNAKYGWLGRKKLSSKVTPRTINYELQTIETFFAWAIRQNYLFVNPVSLVERFRLPKRVLPKFITSEDLRKFLAACTDAQRRLFGTILLTGMRKGEIEHLCWSDISFELGVIFIQEKPEFDWKPKTDERLIPISPMLNTMLLVQHSHRTSDLLVFPNDAGNRDTHILEKLKMVCRRAGIKQSTVHSLRHSFATHLRMQGVSLADIGELLGHADLASTQIYAKVYQEYLRGVVTKLTPLMGTDAGTLVSATKTLSSAVIEITKEE